MKGCLLFSDSGRSGRLVLVLAAVRTLAPATAGVLLDLELDSLWRLPAALDELTLWHQVLLHRREEGEHGFGLAHTSHSDDLIVLVDVVGKELALGELSLDDDLLVADGVVTDELKRLIVHASPEERDALVRHELVHHVEGNVGSLFESHNPMLNAGSRAGRPVGHGSDIASRVDIRLVRLHKRIADNTAVAIHLDAGLGEEFGVWAHSCAQDHHIGWNLAAIVERNRLNFAVFTLVCRCDKHVIVNSDTIVLVLFLIERSKLFAELESKW